MGRNDVQHFFEKEFTLNTVEKCDKVIFVEFNSREMAERAMDAFYGKLVINVKSNVELFVGDFVEAGGGGGRLGGGAADSGLGVQAAEEGCEECAGEERAQLAA